MGNFHIIVVCMGFIVYSFFHCLSHPTNVTHPLALLLNPVPRFLAYFIQPFYQELNIYIPPVTSARRATTVSLSPLFLWLPALCIT